MPSGVERVVVASSDKAYGAHDELPYREDLALLPTAPYEASKAAADLIAQLVLAGVRAAGRGDALRQRLRGRRPQLLPPRSGGGLSRRSTGRPPVLRSDGSPLRDLLYVEDAAARLPGDRRSPRPRRRPRRGLQRGGRAALLGARDRRGGEPGCRAPESSRRSAVPATRAARSTASSSTRRSCASAAGGSRPVSLDEGLERTIAWYRDHPEARPAPRTKS